jgi:hypothetical protein
MNIGKEKGMKDETLLKITVVTDDSTGIYNIGDLDYSRPTRCLDFLDKPGNRKRFADWLRKLADAAEHGKPPFRRI